MTIGKHTCIAVSHGLISFMGSMPWVWHSTSSELRKHGAYICWIILIFYIGCIILYWDTWSFVRRSWWALQINRALLQWNDNPSEVMQINCQLKTFHQFLLISRMHGTPLTASQTPQYSVIMQSCMLDCVWYSSYESQVQSQLDSKLSNTESIGIFRSANLGPNLVNTVHRHLKWW